MGPLFLKPTKEFFFSVLGSWRSSNTLSNILIFWLSVLKPDNLHHEGIPCPPPENELSRSLGWTLWPVHQQKKTSNEILLSAHNSIEWWIDIASVSTISRLDSGNVTTEWYFVYLILCLVLITQMKEVL